MIQSAGCDKFRTVLQVSRIVTVFSFVRHIEIRNPQSAIRIL
jgi:hypothetical protein